MSRNIAAIVATALIVTTGAAFGETKSTPLKNGETWADLRGDVVGDVMISEGSEVFDMVAPHRAHDPATVPVKITQNPLGTQRITEIALVIDENPAPVAATFKFGESMGHIDMEVRVRVNVYSNVRAVATTEDGAVHMAGRFVKAAGGCSAPSGKDPELAASLMGKMKFRELGDSNGLASSRREAKLQVQHPNFSGLQRDQVTLLTIPAHFISELEVRQGDDLLFSMEGGISISEDPTFHFFYNDNGSDTIYVRAVDTDGNAFEQSFKKSTAEG